MRSRHLYQSVEDRGRVEYTPIFCEAKDAWLGKGYYFWDSEIKDAHWWGQEHYNGFYVICQSKYDYDSLEYFDLLGNTDHRKYLFTFAEALINRYRKQYSVAETLELLKLIDKSFLQNYKAVRALPESLETKVRRLYFDKNEKYFISNRTRIQMCVIDLGFLLEGEYVSVYHSLDNITVV